MFTTHWWGTPGFLTYNRMVARGNYDARILSLASGKDELLVGGPGIERDAIFSPDGRWFAYSSLETGRFEIYVRAFGRPGGPWQVSTAGGLQPSWRADGRELYYYSYDGNLMAVPVSAGQAFQAGAPQPLFRTSLRRTNIGQYDAYGAGDRFILNVLVGEEASSMMLVQNWPATLREQR